MKENICINTHTMDNILFLIYDVIKYLYIKKEKKDKLPRWALFNHMNPFKSKCFFSGWWQKEMRKCHPYLP